MDTNNNLQQHIDETINVLDDLKPVSLSPFFKDKTMNVLFAEKQEEQDIARTWFTPKWQLATLALVVVLNIMAFAKRDDTSTYDEAVTEFAESYGLSTSDDTLILNN